MHWIIYFFIFVLRWLLRVYVSAKHCHPQVATMFLSEPLQRQYGRRQVWIQYLPLKFIWRLYWRKLKPYLYKKAMSRNGMYTPTRLGGGIIQKTAIWARCVIEWIFETGVHLRKCSGTFCVSKVWENFTQLCTTQYIYIYIYIYIK
jgi:hypothetical protein